MIVDVKGVRQKQISDFVKELESLPDEIENVTKRHDKKVHKIAKDYARYEHALYVGRVIRINKARDANADSI